MKNSTKVVFILILCATSAVTANQTPVPLPHDANLHIYISVAGNYRSISLNQVRHWQSPADVAVFAPGEQPNIEDMAGRLVLQYQVPQEEGWAYLQYEEDTVTLSLHVTDAQNRLGHLVVRSWQSGQTLTQLSASSDRSRIEGTLEVDVEEDHLIAELRASTGALLATLLLDKGFPNVIIPFAITKSFEPYRPEQLACDGHTPVHYYGQVWGRKGDPEVAFDTKTPSSDTGASAAASTFTNDSASVAPWAPPRSFQKLRKRKVIYGAEVLEIINRLKEVKAYENDIRAVRDAVQAILNSQDLSYALPEAQLLPYSTGDAAWQAFFSGTATAVLAVPYERVKTKEPKWRLLVGALLEAIPPENNFLTTVLKKAAERWLAEQKKDEIGLQGSGDIIELGNIYILDVKKADPTPWFPALQNLTQEWTVYVKVRYPNGNGGWTIQDAEGDVEAVHDAPLTSPSPPAFPSPGIVHVGTDGATIHLGKGWRWKLKLTAPGGEEKLVEVPAQNTVVTLYITLQTPPGQPPGGS